MIFKGRRSTWRAPRWDQHFSTINWHINKHHIVIYRMWFHELLLRDMYTSTIFGYISETISYDHEIRILCELPWFHSPFSSCSAPCSLGEGAFASWPAYFGSYSMLKLNMLNMLSQSSLIVSVFLRMLMDFVNFNSQETSWNHFSFRYCGHFWPWRRFQSGQKIELRCRSLALLSNRIIWSWKTIKPINWSIFTGWFLQVGPNHCHWIGKTIST